jgi:MYXO-CTERM domain-containing protein
VCTADACREPSGCSHTPIEDCCVDADECDDGDACTRDTCSSNRCRNEPIPGCSGEDGGMPVRDGGANGDAGATGDGGATGDAGAPRGSSGGGCSCSTPGTMSSRAPLSLLLGVGLLGLAVWRRRRGSRS